MPNKILAFGFIGALFFGAAARGDEVDKKTLLTVNEPLIVPGTLLQPGKYVMKLADSQSDRHIVQIFNEDQDQLIATIFAIPNQRTTPNDTTSLMYWETPAGPALRSWFFPGDTEGQEFAYPKATADRITAANNGARVVIIDTPATTPTTELAAAPAKRSADQEAFAERAAPPPTATAPAVPETAPEPVAAPRQDTIVIAQNQPPPANPVAQPNAAQPAQPATTAAELPATASPLGWLTLVGILSLSGAILMHRRIANY